MYYFPLQIGNTWHYDYIMKWYENSGTSSHQYTGIKTWQIVGCEVAGDLKTYRFMSVFNGLKIEGRSRSSGEAPSIFDTTVAVNETEYFTIKHLPTLQAEKGSALRCADLLGIVNAYDPAKGDTLTFKLADMGDSSYAVFVKNVGMVRLKWKWISNSQIVEQYTLLSYTIQNPP